MDKLYIYILISILSFSCGNIVKEVKYYNLNTSPLSHYYEEIDSLERFVKLEKVIPIDSTNFPKRVYDFKVINDSIFVIIEVGFLHSIKIFIHSKYLFNLAERISRIDPQYEFSDLICDGFNIIVLDGDNNCIYKYNLQEDSISQFSTISKYTNIIKYDHNYIVRINYLVDFLQGKDISEYISFDILDSNFNKYNHLNVYLSKDDNLIPYIPLNMVGWANKNNNLYYISADKFNLSSINLKEEYFNWVNSNLPDNIKLVSLKESKITEDLDKNQEKAQFNPVIRKMFINNNDIFFVLTVDKAIMYDENGLYIKTLDIFAGETYDFFNNKLYSIEISPKNELKNYIKVQRFIK